MTDYEVRDLNDEINQLVREKRHWETQIVNLGGANYKRAQGSMIDDDGKEVPGTRGYKYFGRARDLPGVKEMFHKGGKLLSADYHQKAWLTNSASGDRGVCAKCQLPDVSKPGTRLLWR